MRVLIALSCAILLGCSFPHPVLAQTTITPPDIPPETLRGVSEPAKRLRLEIARWIDQHGYKPYQRNAILRLIWRESRFVPGVIARSGSACLLQWVGPRKSTLFHGGRSCPPWQSQLEHMNWELHNVKGYAAFWDTGPKTIYPVLRQKFAMGR